MINRKYNLIIVLIMYMIAVKRYNQYKLLSLFSFKYLFQSIDINVRKLYFFEYKTKAKLKTICKKYNNEKFAMIDVGAHNGDTAFAIQPYFENINITCIDPSKKKCLFINTICEKNNIHNISVFNYGVSNIRGRGALIKRNLYDFINSAQHKITEGNDFNIIKIDDLDYKYPVKVINLDVEGYELKALRGAENILINDGPELIIEFKHSDINKIETYLKNIGYIRTGWKNRRNVHFIKN